MKTVRLTTSLIAPLIFGSFFSCSSNQDDPPAGTGTMQPEPSNGMQIPEGQDGMPTDNSSAEEVPGSSEGGATPVGIDDGQTPDEMTPAGGGEMPPMATDPPMDPPMDPPEEPPVTEPEPPEDPTFQGRLRAAYEDAIDSGRFANTYALESLQEYWAEGVQSWYNTNLESIPANGVHNEIDKRAELETYDPVLYGLIAELLPADNEFQDCYADVPLPE